MNTHLTGATLVQCDAGMSVCDADLIVRGGVIEAILPSASPTPPGTARVDLRGKWVMPGLIQPHIHLVQTLFRGLADDLLLLDWLRTRVWPLEAAHDEESTYWSARLGISELLLGGTTSILDMATVHHTGSVFRAAEEAGIRAFIGKAMMDRPNEAGLSQPTEQSLRDACALADRHHQAGGRQRYAFAPRFVPSCTDTLMVETAREARARGCLLHTHASENEDEVGLVRHLTGRDNVEHLGELGFLGPDVVLAHCVHLTESERRLLASTDTTVAHCPGSNLKLGSGIAPIPELIAAGVRCTIAADGAPCNNRLDGFAEMRLAALMQKPRLTPQAMPAPTVLAMATRHGATALGLNAGQLTVGASADFVVLNPDVLHALGGGDVHGAIVYAMTPACVSETWIEGERVAADGQVRGWDTAETVRECKAALRRVRARAGL